MRPEDLWERIDFYDDEVLDFARGTPPQMLAEDYRASSFRELETWTAALLTAAKVVPPQLFELVANQVLRVHRQAEEVDEWLDTDWKSIAGPLVEAFMNGELSELPTLCTSHSTDLKLESPQYRVWLSRVEPFLVSIEAQRDRGVWETVWEGERILHRDETGFADLPDLSCPPVPVLSRWKPNLNLHQVAFKLELGGEQKVHEVYVIARDFEEAKQILGHHLPSSAALEKEGARLASLSITVWPFEAIPEEFHDKTLYKVNGVDVGTVADWLLTL